MEITRRTDSWSVNGETFRRTVSTLHMDRGVTYTVTRYDYPDGDKRLVMITASRIDMWGRYENRHRFGF